MRLARQPCLVLLAYTVAVVIGVTALVAKEGPWVLDGWPSIACSEIADVPWTAGHPNDNAVDARDRIDRLDRELRKGFGDQQATLLKERAALLRCAEVLDAVARTWEHLVGWHAVRHGHFNWPEAGSICLWLVLLLLPPWVYACVRRRSPSRLTVEEIEAKRMPR